MPVRVSGFAKGLVRCLDFESVSVEQLDRVLVDAAETLDMGYVEPSADVPFIQSGTTFADLIFAQHGTAVPWQSPHSELAAPFLIGVHEFLMDTERWVARYSAVTEAVVARIPKGVMTRVVEELLSVRERMHQLVMRRLASFYWVSLASSGAPASRVAVALVSRLALEDRDFDVDSLTTVRQTDIARLTTMSRSGCRSGSPSWSGSRWSTMATGQGCGSEAKCWYLTWTCSRITPSSTWARVKSGSCWPATRTTGPVAWRPVWFGAGVVHPRDRRRSGAASRLSVNVGGGRPPSLNAASSVPNHRARMRGTPRIEWFADQMGSTGNHAPIDGHLARTTP